MRVLIDVCHPSDVHLFKNFYKIMLANGHTIKFTARHKEVSFHLLYKMNLPYSAYGKSYKSTLGKIIGLFISDFRLYRIANKFKPDIALSHGSFYLSHAAFLLKIPHITFEDTGNIEQILLYKYFSKVILTPESFVRDLGKKQIRFKGTKELAYLHPNNFAPDKDVLNDIGVKPGERFVILRFVGWNASHDFGHNGLTYSNKLRIIMEISKTARVFISSESPLPEELVHLGIKIAPEKILSVMYYADLLFGESATMASECALLGTPAIFVNNARISYTLEQEEKYNLIYNFSESDSDQEKSIQKAIELMQLPNLKSEWKLKQIAMMKDQIDLTSFMVWFIENYPESKRIMKEYPDYQYNFK